MSQDFGKGKWVFGRKQHRCEACFGPIPKGEKHYHYQGLFDGDWQNWRMHEECEQAYADNCYGDYDISPGESPVPERIKALGQEVAR